VDWNAINWAKGEAQRLRGLGESERDYGTPGTIVAAVTFLRVHAGATSTFSEAAEHADNQSWGLRTIADALECWCSYVEAGLPLDEPFELRSRVEASTDLMAQVDILLSETGVHPAAAVMLAGAALEELLRGLVLGNGLAVSGHLGINSYASALREKELISKQDKKMVDAWGGLRNEAAHGNFANVTRDQAMVMMDGVNLFVSKYS
jgi:hypothetical protein